MKTTLYLLAAVMMMAVSTTQAATLTVTDDLIFWLKADAGVSATGSDVDSWADQSTSDTYGANDATSAGGSRPTFISSVAALNNMPVVRFDGNSDELSTAAFIDGSTEVTGPFTVFYVGFADVDGGNSSQIFLDGTTSGARGVVTRYSYGASTGEEVHLGPLAGQPTFEFDPNAYHIGTFIYNTVGNPNGALLNGQPAAQTAGANSLSSEGFIGLTVGGRFIANEGVNLKGDIAEMLLYQGILTNEETAQVGQYLAERYALSYAGIVVPEPTSVVMILPVATGLLMRRRGR